MTVDEIIRRITSDLNYLRTCIAEPVYVPLWANLTIEVRPDNDADGLLVCHDGMGYTFINYTPEDLVIEVYANEDINPVHSAYLDKGDLT